MTKLKKSWIQEIREDDAKVVSFSVDKNMAAPDEEANYIQLNFDNGKVLHIASSSKLQCFYKGD
jgi:hypothetical protein